ncbi:MAG: alpha/beta hydrolase [Trueperaceae bacterium]
MRDRSDAEVEARLPRAAAPNLVVMGSKYSDFPDPGAEARWIAERLRGEVQIVDGAGHYPQTEMPDETASVILEFLQRNRHGA